MLCKQVYVCKINYNFTLHEIEVFNQTYYFINFYCSILSFLSDQWRVLGETYAQQWDTIGVGHNRLKKSLKSIEV